MRDECVSPRLRHQTLPRVYKDHGQVCGAGTGNHVAGVLFVTGSIRDDELPAHGVEVAVGNVDGDALFPLGLQPIGEQGKVDSFTSTPFVITLGRGDLILKGATSVDKETADKRGLTVVNAACSNESKQADAQK